MGEKNQVRYNCELTPSRCHFFYSAVVSFRADPNEAEKMIGEKGLRLIKDLMAGSPDLIPPFDYTMVDILINEMQRYFQLNQEQA